MGNYQSCRSCEEPLTPGKSQCPSCKTWNMVVRKKEIVYTTLADVDDEDVPRICIPFWWGGMIGGGNAESQVTLMGGEPGAGKTTFILQAMRDAIKETGQPALLLSSEMKVRQIKPYARRIGMDDDCLSQVVVIDDLETDLKCLNNILGGFCIAALDSLSGLAGMSELLSCQIAARINRFSKRTRIPFWILDHVTKDRDFAGFMFLQHEVDTTVYLREHPGKPRRTWTTRKNRFGSGNVVAEVCMTATGLVPMTMNAKGDWVIPAPPALDAGNDNADKIPALSDKGEETLELADNATLSPVGDSQGLSLPENASVTEDEETEAMDEDE